MNGDSGKSDIEEITLAIALLGGVIAVLLKISDFFNNNVIPPDSDLPGIASFFLSLLLVEFLIILLFFLFKGISRYAKPECWKEKLKKFTQALFKFSFIYFFLWLIALILTFIFVYIIYYNIELSNDSGIFFLYELVLLILLVIVGLVLWDYSIFESIFRIPYSLGEFWKRNKKLFLLFIFVIVLVFVYLFFLSLYSLLSLYLLMGSYSIEEFLQPNNDNIAIGIKETGIIFNASYINLKKIDTDFAHPIDVIKITYNQVNSSEKGFMNGTNNEQLGLWYININTSKLEPGNYLLHAEVTIFKSPALGTVKKRADKLFYIPPKSTNYSFNST